MCLLPVVSIACTFRYEPNKYVQPRGLCLMSRLQPAATQTQAHYKHREFTFGAGDSQWIMLPPFPLLYISCTCQPHEQCLHPDTIIPTRSANINLPVTWSFPSCSWKELGGGGGAVRRLFINPCIQIFRRGCVFSFPGSGASSMTSHSKVVYE